MHLPRFRSLHLSIVLAVSLLLVAATSAFAADKRDFTLYNNTSIDIKSVYVSPSAADNWQEDVLGRDILVSGDYVDIVFSGVTDTCIYDIKVTGFYGQQGVLYNVNLCRTSTVTFSDS